MEAAVINYLVPFVGGHEGKVLKAYLDPVHVVTIGYGFTWGSKVFRDWWMTNRGSKLKLGDTMTAKEAFDVLLLVLKTEYIPPVERKFAGKPSYIVAAGSSMVYNCGTGALAWSWATLIAGGQIVEGIKRWRTTGTTAKGKKLPGLARRRNEEADIAATGKWPAWVKPLSKLDVGPETHTASVDYAQAQRWLEELGYNPGPADGVPGQRTKAAAARFQSEHGQLTVDGIIGPATLAALQRAIALKKKGAGTIVGTGTVAGGGLVEETGTKVGDSVVTPAGDLGWVGDVLLWGGLAVGIAVLIYFVWRYKDEINNVLRKVA